MATDHDAEIIAAWRTRKAAYSRYNVLPMADGPGDMTPEERAEWAIIDKAEAIIRTSVARTPRGVAVQLWVAFQHGLTSRADDAAAQSANLAYFADDSERDWTEKMAIAALRAYLTLRSNPEPSLRAPRDEARRMLASLVRADEPRGASKP